MMTKAGLATGSTRVAWRITGRRRMRVGALALLVSAGLLATAPPAQATFRGDNGKILFTSLRDGNGELYVMNPDGSGQTRLTDDIAFDSEAAWSPDGTQIVFNREIEDQAEIFVMNADGSGLRRLTFHPARDFHPDWTPDGRILFDTQRDGGDWDIYIMNADGSGQTPLTANSANDFLPAASPDPTAGVFSFTSNIDGDQEIYTMRLDGSELRQLTHNNGNDGLSNWSPSGNELLFSSSRDANGPPVPSLFGPQRDAELYRMKANGHDQTRLTFTADRTEFQPVWSPDGKRMAFTACPSLLFPGGCEVYVAATDGTGEVQLTTLTGVLPDWQPVPR